MRVLVTGASGHVGGAIAGWLTARGATVIGLARKPSPGLPAGRLALFDIASVGTGERIARQIERCDIIVHAAAHISKELLDVSVPMTNCLGSQEVLALAHTWKVDHLVYISSVPVIGTPRSHPITEEHTTLPQTAYHASKLFAEHLVGIADRNGLAGASLRITAPVGPGMAEKRILPVFIRRAMSGDPIRLAGRGTRRQDFVDVRDIARAVDLCIASRARGVFNLGSGRAISNDELARACIAELKSASSVEFTGGDDPEEDMTWDISIERARTGFGYQPLIPLEQTIRDLAATYARSHSK